MTYVGLEGSLEGPSEVVSVELVGLPLSPHPSSSSIPILPSSDASSTPGGRR